MLRSVRDVADVVRSRMSPDYRIVVGIAGAPGGGKSTIAAELVELLAPDATLLAMDGFHLSQSRLVELGRRDRMGAPDTFDLESFRATLIEVRRGFGSPGQLSTGQSSPRQSSTGQSVSAPDFDRETEEPHPDALHIDPEFPCVVVEGNYLLLDTGGWERIAPLLDLTFFVELDREKRLERLVARHERFGKSPADALAWALGPDETNAVAVEKTAARADYRVALG